jgi:hypothetical protein
MLETKSKWRSRVRSGKRCDGPALARLTDSEPVLSKVVSALVLKIMECLRYRAPQILLQWLARFGRFPHAGRATSQTLPTTAAHYGRPSGMTLRVSIRPPAPAERSFSSSASDTNSRCGIPRCAAADLARRNRASRNPQRGFHFLHSPNIYGRLDRFGSCGRFRDMGIRQLFPGSVDVPYWPVFAR